MNTLRSRLVEVALEWERAFGNAPAITSVLSELDAADLVGCSIQDYSACMQKTTAVQKGHDFIFNGKKYQVKGNRPSGKPRSKVTLVGKAKNYNWDFLIWVLYDPQYQVQEVWQWEMNAYKKEFDHLKKIRPDHVRGGKRLFPATVQIDQTTAPPV